MRCAPLSVLAAAALLLGAETTQPAQPDSAETTSPAESTQPAGASEGEPAGAPVPSDAAPQDLALTWTEDTPVAEILWALGEPKPDHWREPNADLAKAGEEIFRLGRTTGPDGKPTKRVARVFECTDCHNTVQEDPDLRVSDPEARLDHAVANDLPFLPGTTVYGIVDRTSWFNDDYVKKYGDWVEPANESLVEATQLCSRECSQGRHLTEWEMDAVLTYFWTLGLRWKDLPADGTTLQEAETAFRVGEPAGKARALEGVRAKFFAKSPATFGELPEEYGKDGPGYPYEGDPERGREIYTRSCMHCHDSGGAAFHRFRDKKCAYRTLYGSSGAKNVESYYFVIRNGTKPAFDKYMPLFPEERMSDQQVEDLRAWITQEATRKGKRP